MYNSQMKLIDMTGMKVGRATVIRKGPPRPKNFGGSSWLCACECGNEFFTTGSNLRKGGVVSCGCYAKEWASKMGANREYLRSRVEKQKKHGHKSNGQASPEYKTWLGMKRRCYSEKFKDYPNWGGRGIKVCDRWNLSFSAFYEDMGPKPSLAHTLDRIDPNSGYSKENCRWATPHQQGAENRRGLMPVTVEGVTFTSVSAAAKHFGVNPSTAWMRIEAGIATDVAVSSKERLPARRARESYLRKDCRP